MKALPVHFLVGQSDWARREVVRAACGARFSGATSTKDASRVTCDACKALMKPRRVYAFGGEGE